MSDPRRYYPPVTEHELPEHVARNRVYWDEVNAPLYAAPGARAWARQEITWGTFGIPEDELHALPADLAGMDVVELGCGTAYFGARLARRGAHVIGIDNSAEQLKTARRLQDEHDLHFPLIHGNAEATGLPDASFDLAVSEYGTAIWADPHRWIPQAARILRPGGELVFLGNGTFWVLTVLETNDEGPAADRLLRASGFEVLDLIDIRAPDDLDELRGDGLVDPDWARKWPAEQIWRVRRMNPVR